MRSFPVRSLADHDALLLLLKTFLDIIALRRGPESVPSSGLVLGFALLLMLLSSLLGSLVTASNGEVGYMVAFLAYGISMLFYAAVIYFTGHAARMLVALSCIIACGSLLTILFVIEFAIFTPLFGREAAGAIASMIILWSVPVEGHIMTRTIACHWFVGILVAVVSLVLQFSIHSAFAGSG